MLFTRSLDWWPCCKAQAVVWSDSEKDFTDLGYNVAMISSDDVGSLAHFAKRRKVAFTLLSDSNTEIIEAFDVLNDESTFHSGIAHPTIFVTDAKGVITHRFSEFDYSSRPDVSDVLEAFKK